MYGNCGEYVFGIYDKSLDKLINYTCTLPRYCKHENGWFDYIKTFWTKFTGKHIRVFCCIDCESILQGKELKKFEKKQVK